jgi:hypothetical protein
MLGKIRDLTAPVQADEHASALESLRDSRIIHSLV